jgi:nicotinate-nucleotide adenylyltransferase
MKEIGLIGGAFNPPHLGHFQIAQCAQEQHALDLLIFMPSGTPPHKKNDLLDKELRFEMVDAEVKASGNTKFAASRLEIDRPGVTWTIDTLKELGKIYGPDVRFNFIIGEDNIASIARYEKRAELLSLCRLLVAPRAIANQQDLEQWKKMLPEAGEDGIALIDCPANSLSSTLVRSYVRAGRSLRYLVPQAVIAVIEAKGLYKSNPAPATP